MTSLPAGSVFPELNTRGSTHIGAPGLFVLGLGSLVLLTGLAPPVPAVNDVVALVIPTGPVEPSLPWWLAGLAVFVMAVVVMRLRRRVQSHLLLPAGL